MKYGPFVFLAALIALAASWCGFVLAPQIQLGNQQQETNAVNTAELYPLSPNGLARQGLQVYRENGCAACHTEQARQTGIAVDVVLTDLGTNRVAVAEALAEANLGLPKMVPVLAAGLPKAILQRTNLDVGKSLHDKLSKLGANVSMTLVPLGPDMDRGWGKRRSVAADFIYDTPVMLGSLRVGPDLANVGMRLPDPNWQLQHLYAPRSLVKDSPMPPYRFLFEKRKIRGSPSPDALPLHGEDGYEIVPKSEAQALVAYLLSLRADVPLFEAPMPATPPRNTATNAPAGTANALTNAPSGSVPNAGTNSPAK